MQPRKYITYNSFCQNYFGYNLVDYETTFLLTMYMSLQSLREGMGQQANKTNQQWDVLDTVITNALIIDSVTGIIKADIGIKVCSDSDQILVDIGSKVYSDSDQIFKSILAIRDLNFISLKNNTHLQQSQITIRHWNGYDEI